MTVEDILRAWEAKGNVAKKDGTILHKVVEDHILSEDMVFLGKTLYERKIIDSFHSILPDLIPSTTFSEVMVSANMPHNKEEGIAGMIDIVTHPRDKYFNVYDIKTGKRIKTTNDFGEKMFAPLHKLDACTYNRYCLQVNCYAWMYMMKTGRKPGEMGILWWDSIAEQFEYIPVKEMWGELTIMIRDYFKIPKDVKRRKLKSIA
jgi:hypothetical protein